MILLLAGTSEGRRKAVSLARTGLPLMAAVATPHGAELLRHDFQGEIHCGPLDREAMGRLIALRGITRLVDATHPFAEEVSANALAAAAEACIPYERLEREELARREGPGLKSVSSHGKAAALAAAGTGMIFLTVGSRRLEEYTRLIDPRRLVARILPLSSSLEKCLAQGLSPANIVAMQGPFDEQINRLLFARYGASLVISKESGPAGGTTEKVLAARALGIPLILISRPAAGDNGGEGG